MIISSGIIDKASIDGQKQYYKDLDLAMRQYLKDHATEFKEEGDDEEAVSAAASEAALSSPSAPEKSGAPTDSDDALERAAEKEREGIFKYLDMLNTAVGTLADMGGAAFGTLQDLVGGASPGMLVLALVIASLVISNIWTLTSNRGARDPEDVHRLRRSAGASGSGSVVGGAAANGYAQATYPGAYGGAAPGSPEAIALAVRDVLRDYLEPRYGYGHGNANFNDGPNRKRKREEDVEIEDVHMEAGQIEAMIEQVEARVARLREYLKTVERGEGAETRRIEGGGKGGKEEAAGGSGSGSGKGREAGGKAKSNAKTKG